MSDGSTLIGNYVDDTNCSISSADDFGYYYDVGSSFCKERMPSHQQRVFRYLIGLCTDFVGYIPVLTVSLYTFWRSKGRGGMWWFWILALMCIPVFFLKRRSQIFFPSSGCTICVIIRLFLRSGSVWTVRMCTSAVSRVFMIVMVTMCSVFFL